MKKSGSGKDYQNYDWMKNEPKHAEQAKTEINIK